LSVPKNSSVRANANAPRRASVGIGRRRNPPRLVKASVEEAPMPALGLDGRHGSIAF
jgi:hypothetical protein